MNPSVIIRKQKIKLRSKVRSRLSAMDRHVLRKKSTAIVFRILKLRVYKQAANVMLYWPLKDEPDLRKLIRMSLKSGKHIYLPRMKSGSRVFIEAYRIEKLPGDLVAGPFGTMQPRCLRSRCIQPSALDLVIVPGVSFDLKGGRLGRGLGCYDRFLKRTQRAVCIGVCFKEQRSSRVPQNSRDIRMHRLVTA